MDTEVKTQKWTGGAMRAAMTWVGSHRRKPDLERELAETISRETKDQEMADLLREAERVFDLIGKFTGGDLTIVEHWREKYAALLSTLEKI